MAKLKLKITDMHCVSCSILIDGDLEDLEGVKFSQTNFAKAETEVEFDEEKVSLDSILKTIKTSGYTAMPLDS